MFKQRKKPKKYCLLNSNVEPKLLEYIPTESVKFNIVIELKCTEYGPIWKFGNKEVDCHYVLILSQATLFLNGHLDKSILNWNNGSSFENLKLNLTVIQ